LGADYRNLPGGEAKDCVGVGPKMGLCYRLCGEWLGLEAVICSFLWEVQGELGCEGHCKGGREKLFSECVVG
jgi:hypothetical protein